MFARVRCARWSEEGCATRDLREFETLSEGEEEGILEAGWLRLHDIEQGCAR